MAQQMQVMGKKRSSDAETLPVKLEIVDVEKKKGISKYYLYVIRVTCRDRSRYIIRRRYRQFDEMQKHLEQRFPVEAGEFSQKERILPNLPGKLYLSRSAVRDVTDRRLPQLNSYLQHLFSLPDNIRYDSIVRRFFLQTSQDSQAIHDNMAPHGYLTKPARPPAPSPASKKSSAPPRPAPPTRVAPLTRPPPPTFAKGPRAKALYEYRGRYDDELSFSAGTVMSLVKEVDSDWIQARVEGQVGLVPLTYITIIEPLSKQDSQDDTHQSDEWDSDEDDEVASHVTYYVGGVANSVEVGSDQVQRPTFHRLKNAIQDHLGRRNFVMNYKDSVGDLIEIVDQSDLELMVSESVSSRHQQSHAPWTLYITDWGDYTPYNTHPYR